MRARPLVAALTTGALMVASGCGNGTTPADDVPALATSLDEVDDAIAAGEYDAARDAVVDLRAVAREARRAGDLDASDADRITETADALLAALPEGTVDEGAPTEPAPEAPTTSTPSEDGEDGDGGGEDSEGSGPDPDPDPGGKPDKPDKPDKSGKPEKKGKGD